VCVCVCVIRMRAYATKLFRLATDLSQMRSIRIGKYVSFRDLYEYKYYETDHSEGQKKSDLIDARLGKIDFGHLNLAMMNEDDQTFIADLLGLSAPDFDDAPALFSEVRHPLSFVFSFALKNTKRVL